MKAQTNNSYVSARITPEHLAQLKKLAIAERRTVSQVARFAIIEYLERSKPKGK